MVRIRAFQARGPGSIPGRRRLTRARTLRRLIRLSLAMVQSVRRETTNLEIAGSNPVGDNIIFFSIITVQVTRARAA